MKSRLLLLGCVAGLVACGSHAPADEGADEPAARVAVTLTHAKQGSIREDVTFPARTSYLSKWSVSAPISAYVREACVRPGSRVGRGQKLFTLETKEHRALGEEGGSGLVTVRAESAGVVLDVPQQAGGYVTEGGALCTVADAGSLVFLVSVPYEQRRQARSGSRCRVELPDGTQFRAVVGETLAAVDAASQTEQVVARAQTPFLPEGMQATASFSAAPAAGSGHLVVPKQAVQSDETLSAHWVVRMVTDSTVEKVPVEVVRGNAREAEIVSAALSPRDRLVLTGGYGLENGTKVAITGKEETHE